MKPVVILFFAMCLLINGCAAVRLGGRISQATGDVMVKSADEEETKESKKQTMQKTNSSSENNKVQKGNSISKKDSLSNEAQIITIKMKHAAVNVRPDPSTNKPPIAQLKGGDKATKIGESGTWLKIKFDNNGKQSEGWIVKDLVTIK